MKKSSRGLIIALGLIVFVSLNNLFGQAINFKHYGIEEGITHPTIYTINQDKSGFILIGTGAGIGRFDGLKFSKPYSKDTLGDKYSSSSFKDNEGRIWFGFDDGSVYCYEGNKLAAKISNEQNSSLVNAFAQYSSNEVLAVTQNTGFYIIDNNGNVTRIINSSENKLFFSVAKLNEGSYLLGTSEGLFKYKIDKNLKQALEEVKVKDIPTSKIQCIIPISNSNDYWIGTEDAGLFRLSVSTDKNTIKALPVGNNLGLNELNIQWVLEDYQQNLWVCTFGSGLIKLAYNQQKKTFDNPEIFNTENGLGDNFIKNAIQDKEGNIWIGSYSNGLWGIIDEAFVFYNFKNEGFNDILSIATTKDYVFVASRKALVKEDKKNTKNRKLYSEKNGLPNDAINTLLVVNGVLWIGTEKLGVYKLDIQSDRLSNFFYSTNSIENKINAIDSRDNILWLATNGGVISIDLRTGKKQHYSTDTGLPHNKINDIFIDSKGSVWIATKSNGLVSLNTERDKKIQAEGNAELEFTCITEDKYGQIWAGTYGDGLFEFKEDSLFYYSEKDGLKSDYCYSLVTDEEGNIWVGHRLALSKVNPSTRKIMSYGPEIGITGDFNANTSCVDEKGVLRFGTTDGLIQYNFQKNRQKLQPPLLNLLSIKVSDKEIDFTGKLELPYGIYRMRFDFVGLNYRSPSSVKYQYKLEGWETEWSELTDNTFAYYPRVEDGKYTFLVRAFNAEGITSPEPLKIEVYIAPPIWKRWWFILLCVVLVIAGFVSYVKYREKKQIQFQIYLQKLLDERTREVIEQKEEIELKNRDITDSITYAQRIQASILPSVRKLKDNFSGCFIFYQPRDIVSGDFYWFDRISDSKFVIVCGDSTGHGVPGALMSMIGTTLIKDICNRPDVVAPSNILEKLDDEMRQTLNQNMEAEKSSDGMDMIACEIDIETYKVRIASAMRPVILYQNGEQIYVQGSKSSIGGNEFGCEEKLFEDQEYQLAKGDLIYMFSDGYPDQFGGPMGKKFKMVRLRSLLKDIHHLPMEEQNNHVKNSFNLWKDTYEQVDDVLFMGIRL